MNGAISEMTLRRLPLYLRYLNAVKDERQNVSASVIASYYGLNDVQVRKDLAAVSGSGKPKTGYDVRLLIAQIEDCLGCKDHTSAILVGVGNLGKSLLGYKGFSDYGIEIAAAFDRDESLIGTSVNGKLVLPLSELDELCFERGITLAIITVPALEAQGICDRLTSCGIRAVWNFAPTLLKAPSGVLVENENLASSLAILSKHLRERSQGRQAV
ncbi:MAG TPA: redox-sensing transcriptional repressor Rex [Clostridia bacterium]|nr:redox-sensing transcriptional repressor Rex [Clostridia bacterium]